MPDGPDGGLRRRHALIVRGLDEALDDIGLAFPYAREAVKAMPAPDIERLRGRARAHLKRLYEGPWPRT